jgi:hypothetical protein
MWTIMNETGDCPMWIFKNLSKDIPINVLNNAFFRRNLPGITFVFLQMVVGLLGNLIVLFVYLIKYKPSNYRLYVLFLALIDIANSIFAMPFTVLFLSYPVDFPNEHLCKGGLMISYAIAVMSAGGLILIAYDRYRKVCFPLQSQLSFNRAKFGCLCIVVTSFLSSSITPFLYSNNELLFASVNATGHQCYLTKSYPFSVLAKGYYFVLISVFLLVSTILCLFYYRIYVTVKSTMKYFDFNTGRTETAELRALTNRQANYFKTSITFFAISFIYIVFTLPHLICGLLYHIYENLECDMDEFSGTIFYFLYWTVFINNIANPFIYGVSDRRFQQIIRGMCARKSSTTKAT